jgi:hypothetical protein
MRYIFATSGLALVLVWGCVSTDSQEVKQGSKELAPSQISLKDTLPVEQEVKSSGPVLDTAEYNKRMHQLANGDSTGRWPAKAPYPRAGAVLPFHRVVAYYGNLFSTRMGVLGEYPKKEMIKKLFQEVHKWEKADPHTPVKPALHYIAVTAQGSPGQDGKYRLRMPFHQVDTIIKWAREINGLAFVDLQVGHSTVKQEASRFTEYFKQPDFHLGIDPEFSMKGGQTPGTVIGKFDASDINDAIDLLAQAVRENNLPPKILVIHRFTQDMIMNYKAIRKVPEVQIVVDMDGWGSKALKAGTYKRHVFREPVQFTGFKLFYKNDVKNGNHMFTPEELLKFTPKPIYIQYQ